LSTILPQTCSLGLLMPYLDTTCRRRQTCSKSVISDVYTSITGMIVGKIDPLIHHRTRNPVYPRLPPSRGPRMPTLGVAREVLARDAYRCRFCGCRVVVKEARETFIKALPTEAKLDGRGCHHFAFGALRASVDHVVPFRRGGTNEMDNLVTTCGPCQFGRGHWLLEECELEDPRRYPPLWGPWDGLIRLRGLKNHSKTQTWAPADPSGSDGSQANRK
jgi:hypothetical protein